jgi:hypothetical protein
VNDSGLIRLTLELERGDPLRARVGPVGGPLVAFEGWIGLGVAIDRAIRDEDLPSDGPERRLR